MARRYGGYMTAEFVSCLSLCVQSAFSRSRPSLSLRSAAPHYSQRLNGTRRMTFSQLISPLTFPSSGFELTDVSEKIEEEPLPAYNAEKYYPARIGEISTTESTVISILFNLNLTILATKTIRLIRSDWPRWHSRVPCSSTVGFEFGTDSSTFSLPGLSLHSLERLAEDFEGENKKGFLECLQGILRWLPEKRPTAEEPVFEPWLRIRGKTT
ncbi:hypothetical protein GX48_04729 [Paracoccidioides brasiliensis]|nr:hypothetical protein GX48_04729 [Paracoccidioides brasiliensis]